MRALSASALYPAELRELRYAADGYTTAEAARAGVRAVETVRSHRKRVLAKLGARNMVHAVHLAHEQGLLGAGLPDADRAS